MSGTSSDIVFADAMKKGIAFDQEGAFKSMIKMVLSLVMIVIMVENNYQLLFLEVIQVKNKMQDFLGQWKV